MLHHLYEDSVYIFVCNIRLLASILFYVVMALSGSLNTDTLMCILIGRVFPTLLCCLTAGRWAVAAGSRHTYIHTIHVAIVCLSVCPWMDLNGPSKETLSGKSPVGQEDRQTDRHRGIQEVYGCMNDHRESDASVMPTAAAASFI